MNTNCDKIPLDIKNGEVIMKRILKLLLIITVLFSNISICKLDTYAADGTVKIFLGDNDTPRHHKAIEEGGLSEYLSFELNDGKVKSSSFTSGNTSLFKIEEINGKTYVRGVKEGTGYVTLTVTNDENKTFTERLFISIYKRVENCTGKLNKVADGYRGASDNANVEKEDAKGKIAKDTEVNVIASCSDYYLIKTKDGRLFDDELDTAFVKKADIYIPVKAIEVVDNNIKVKKGDFININNNSKFSNEELKLYGNDIHNVSVIIKPSIATNKGLTFNISNRRIISYDENNRIESLRTGDTNIAVVSKDNKDIKDQLNVTVTNEISKNILGDFNLTGSSGIDLNVVEYSKSLRANEYFIQQKNGDTWKTVYEFYGNKAPGLKVRLLNKKIGKKYTYRVLARKVNYVVNNIKGKDRKVPKDYEVLAERKSNEIVISTGAPTLNGQVVGIGINKKIKITWSNLQYSRNPKKVKIYYKLFEIKNGKYTHIKTIKSKGKPGTTMTYTTAYDGNEHRFVAKSYYKKKKKSKKHKSKLGNTVIIPAETTAPQTTTQQNSN